MKVRTKGGDPSSYSKTKSSMPDKEEYKKKNPDWKKRAEKEKKARQNYIMQKAKGFPGRPDLQAIESGQMNTGKMISKKVKNSYK